MTYEQAREDHEYLWGTYGAAHNMTGGYVDQHDLHKLLETPTRETVRRCYEDQIEYWFESGTADCGLGQFPSEVATDPRIAEIADRHCCEIA